MAWAAGQVAWAGQASSISWWSLLLGAAEKQGVTAAFAVQRPLRIRSSSASGSPRASGHRGPGGRGRVLGRGDRG
jgi:hypothetical protein